MSNKIDQITILVWQIQNSHNGELTIAQEWMLKNVQDQKLRRIIPKISIVAYHILEVLVNNKELTGVKIAEQLGVTRGGVTRATQKMRNAELITAIQHKDNKKNIYYRLTDQGKRLAHLHTKMHEELYQQLQEKIVAEFTDEELDTIIRFLSEIKDNVI